MKALLHGFVRSPVAANLLMMLIILGGLASIGSIRRQIFPDFQSDRIEISVELPGAGPQEVETGLVLRIEDSLKDLQALERKLEYRPRSDAEARSMRHWRTSGHELTPSTPFPPILNAPM